jgi:hypothetical protein
MAKINPLDSTNKGDRSRSEIIEYANEKGYNLVRDNLHVRLFIDDNYAYYLYRHNGDLYIGTNSEYKFEPEMPPFYKNRPILKLDTWDLQKL